MTIFHWYLHKPALGPILALLLAAGPVIGVMGASMAVHDAVRSGDPALLRTVIAESASLDARDERGWTALMHAIFRADQAATALLLEAGASADIGDWLGQTPLHLAASKGTRKMCQWLIEAGSNTNSRNAGGVTPIMLAAGRGRSDIVALLLQGGARLDVKDYQGNSVVDWALNSRQPKLVLMLEQKTVIEAEKGLEPAGEDFAEEVFADVHFPDIGSAHKSCFTGSSAEPPVHGQWSCRRTGGHNNESP